MKHAHEHQVAYWAPFVAVAAAVVVGVVVVFAAYVDHKVAPVGEYVAQVYGAPAPQAAVKQEAAKVAAARQVQ